MRVRAGRLLLVVAGGAISVALLGLAFFRLEREAGALRIAPRFDLGAWAADLPSHLPWVLPYVALAASLAALRAIVWGRTLPVPVPRFGPRLHALALGWFVHNALPGHLGVLASAWVLHRHAGTPLPAGLASLLLAKGVEFGALVAVTVVLALAARARGVEAGPVGGMLWVGLVALVIFTAVFVTARRLAPWLAARLLARGRMPRLAAALGSVVTGLEAVGAPRRLLAGVAVGVLPVLASALGYGLGLRHMGVDAYLLGGGLIVGALTLAQLTPGLPTTMGIYYFVCSATARALGVDDRSAAALAALSHAAGAATHILVGLAAALVHHDRLRELVQLRAVARQPPAPAPP